MAYDLEEQETIANAKAWWNRHGNWILWVMTILLAGYALYSGWGWWQRRQASQACGMYYEMQKAVLSGDHARAYRVAQDTRDSFSGTSYAAMTALVAAKMAAAEGNAEKAKTELKWVAENGNGDGYRALAKIRLAGLLLDEKQYDEGLKAVSGTFPKAYESMANDRKGDLLVALGRNGEAKAAYQKAFDTAAQDDPGRQLIQIKLEEVGA